MTTTDEKTPTRVRPAVRAWSTGDANPLLLKKRGPAPRAARKKLGLEEMPYAFGVEPARCHFPLRLARYAALGETIAESALAFGEDRQMQLLDVGSGRGRTMRYAEALGVDDRVEWHGVDLESRRAYRSERWASLADVDVEEGLPFDDQRFDFAVCEQVLEHLHHPERVLADIARVLRPGGRLVAGVPVFPAPIAAARSMIFKGPARALGVQTGHPQTFSARSFARLVAAAGFEVNDVRGFRILSGGPFRPLENSARWYLINRRIGAALPGLTIEAQVVATRL